MKKLTGWVCLVASSIWCFLMIPVVFVAAIVKFDTLFIHPESSGFIYYGSILLGITLNILMAILVVKFGVSLLKSSWRLAKGIEVKRLSLRQRTAHLSTKT